MSHNDNSPPPPPSFAPLSIKNTGSNGMDSIGSFQKSNLKHTETVVTTSFGAKPIVANLPRARKSIERICALIVSQNWLAFKWLSADIEKVLFTSATSRKEMSFEAEHSYKSIYVFENYEDSAFLEYQACKLHRKFQFTHIICHAEEDLIRCARLREYLGLHSPEGQTAENALRYRDKVVMKDVIARSNPSLKLPIYARVSCGLDVYKFLEKHSLPVVIKPTKGYGSVNTSVLRKEEDVEQLLRLGLAKGLDAPCELEIECFVQGQMYHIDGLVYDGKVVFAWPSKYTSTVVDFMSNKFIAGYSLPKNDPLVPRLQQYIVDIIHALGKDVPNPSCFPFHAEAWLTPQDEIVLCEIASRTPGGGIKNEIFELFDVSLTEIWTQGQCGDAPNFTFDTSTTWKTNPPKPDYLVGWMFPYPVVGKLIEIPTKCDLPHVLQYIPLSKPGEVFASRSSCADAIANIVLKADNEEAMKQNMVQTYQWLFDNSKWDPL